MLSNMKSKFCKVSIAIAMAIVTFGCGIVVGQEKLPAIRKYLSPSQATRLDQEFESMEIEELRNAVSALQEIELPNQMIASYYLNPKAGKIQALVLVHGRWADKASLEEVKRSLKYEAEEIITVAKFHFREVSDSDVEVTFTKVNSGKDQIVNDFAEYKNGALVIK